VTRWVRRFSRTERVFHWVNAAFFLTLATTGLILWLPGLSLAVGRRPLLKDIHLWSGVAWVVALVAIVLLGDRRGILRTMRELEQLDNSRLNPGQKVNAILNAAFTILFFVSGVLLWYGERDTRFRFASTVVLHDAVTLGALALLVGHLYYAVINPATRHSLRGMTRGTVDEHWARVHHRRWQPPPAE
jgi:formate dehydrogenase subunit gamma